MTIQKLSKKEMFLFVTILITCFISFSPLKSLALVWPFTLLLLYNIYFYKQCHKFILLIGIYILAGILYSLINTDFFWTNYVLFFITISPFIIIYNFNFSNIVNKPFIDKISIYIQGICCFEAFIGLVQIFYMYLFVTNSFDLSAGDAVEGTISLNLAPSTSGSNQMFAILQSSLLVLLFGWRANNNQKIFPLSIIAISFILASVMHAILFWMISICLAYLILRMKSLKFRAKIKIINLKRSIYILLLVTSLSLIVFVTLSANIKLIPGIIRTTFANGIGGKAIATLNTINNMPDYQIFLGLGPGQYSSRSGMIMTGDYLNVSIPFKGNHNIFLENNILNYWLEMKNLQDNHGKFYGSSHFPFYSWLSLYGEFGLIGVIAIIFIIIRLLSKIIRSRQENNFYIRFSLCIIILYIAFLGFQDNYWEWNQPLLPILLFAKIIYDNLYNRKDVKTITIS